MTHQLLNQRRPLGALLWGTTNFFKPRVPPPVVGRGGPATLSFRGLTPFVALLPRLVDFDRLNSGATLVSVGATHNLRRATMGYHANNVRRS